MLTNETCMPIILRQNTVKKRCWGKGWIGKLNGSQKPTVGCFDREQGIRYYCFGGMK